MSTFGRFFYELISIIFDGIVIIFRGMISGVKKIFAFSEYKYLIENYSKEFNKPEWFDNFKELSDKYVVLFRAHYFVANNFDFGINDISDNSFDKQKGWLYCIFPEKYTKSSYCNTTYCGLYLRKESFINKVLSDSNFFSNLVLQEIEKIEEELVKERNKILEEWRKEQEEYEKELQKQKQIKYANDKKWRDAIHFVKNAFKNNDLNLLKLYVNEDGQIIDYQKENI